MTLTARERDVADLLACGCSDKEIAARLALSVSYVRLLVSRAKAYYRVESRVELAVAHREGAQA